MCIAMGPGENATIRERIDYHEEQAKFHAADSDVRGGGNTQRAIRHRQEAKKLKETPRSIAVPSTMAITRSKGKGKVNSSSSFGLGGIG